MSKNPLGYPDNVCRSAVEKSEPFKSNGGGDFKSSGGGGGVLDCLYKIYQVSTIFSEVITLVDSQRYAEFMMFSQ